MGESEAELRTLPGAPRTSAFPTRESSAGHQPVSATGVEGVFCRSTFKRGREQFHGLGSMYCRGATAVILTYDVSHPQSLLQLEDRFLGLTDTASSDCLFAIVGNKVDLVEEPAAERPGQDGQGPGAAGGGGGAPRAPQQVRPEDAVALYKKILKYRMLDEKDAPAAERMCFETSAKTGHHVDLLFETLFDMVVPVISRQRAQEPPQTVDITSYDTPGRTRSGCCA
ncbi:ras-related protein Rab-20 isoform X2 [Hyaena hyaena]|uniref:ras-related protein Rab-20 isoform X2 n=1 Tax=Hyaena hyaena TaxID=95912 RepID=UPI001923D9FA|nr:ras-related protein Rab-20 isoform X2 [Hyaena hyaena]